MNNVFIFGGSFDPIHFGHLNLIKNILSTVPTIKKFFIVPTGSHPEKKKYFFSDQQRIIVIKLILGIELNESEIVYLDQFSCNISKLQQECLYYNHPSIEILFDEVEQDKVSYTVDLLENLQKKFPSDQLNLLVGADQAMNFSLWKNSDRIAEMAHLWVFSRENSSIDSNFEWNIVDAPLCNISSKQIKKWFEIKDPQFFSCANILPAVKILMPLFFNDSI